MSVLIWGYLLILLSVVCFIALCKSEWRKKEGEAFSSVSTFFLISSILLLCSGLILNIVHMERESERQRIEQINSLKEQVENILDNGNALLVSKDNDLYKYKVGTGVYDVYIEREGSKKRIELIALNDKVIYEPATKD